METELIQQLRAWNPWWEKGIEGIKRYDIPSFKREIYQSVKTQFEKGKQIVSIVGMRQIGKSTIMRQMIRDLLSAGVPPESIFYISFDDPSLQTEHGSSNTDLMEKVVTTYAQYILKKDLGNISMPVYFFLDEIHQLPNWDKKLKAYYDRAYPIKYIISGSSSLRLQKQNRESLLGRISEFILWPFSFREFLEFKSQDNSRLQKSLITAKELHKTFHDTLNINSIIDSLKTVYLETSLWDKEFIIQCLKQYILVGGFPRAWEANLDFAAKQRIIWEQHIVKVLFEDLVKVTNIRKPKELSFLFMQMVQWNGTEFRLRELHERLGVHLHTLDKYLRYLIQTFLIFRIDKTKSRRLEIKRKTGNVKFYLSDVAFKNAIYKKDETVYESPEEMGIIAENLVCSLIQRWISGPYKDDTIQFYKDNSGEVDFIVKQPEKTIPIEVKWREQIKKPKNLERIVKKWKLDESILITKNDELSFSPNGQLSIPLWYFLMTF